MIEPKPVSSTDRMLMNQFATRLTCKLAIKSIALRTGQDEKASLAQTKGKKAMA